MFSNIEHYFQFHRQGGFLLLHVLANVLLSYVNVKIAELDGRKQELVKQIAELTTEAISPEQVVQISDYLDDWDSVAFDDKRRVVDLMISTIAATSDSLNITWKI